VSTHVKHHKGKTCWPDCLTSFSNVSHNSFDYAVIDFKVPGYTKTGDVWVAVRPNDSRIPSREPIQPRKLGDLPNEAGLTNWYMRFTGLKPEHYYTVVIYSKTDAYYGLHNPFSRQCLLTTKHPDDCPDDAYRNSKGVKKC